MLSLKNLAARAIPKNAVPVELTHDIAAITEYNKSVVKTCKHKTVWTYKRNKVDGPVTYTRECVEQWKNDEYVEVVVNCDSMGCVRVWGSGEWGWGVNSI